jgi:hypothetical protein
MKAEVFGENQREKKPQPDAMGAPKRDTAPIMSPTTPHETARRTARARACPPQVGAPHNGYPADAPLSAAG